MVYVSFTVVDGDTLIKTPVQAVINDEETMAAFMKTQREEHNIEDLFVDPTFGDVCILPEDFDY